MTSPRKVNNKNPERHRVLKYLKEHPKELQYIVGDYIARHGIMQKAKGVYHYALKQPIEIVINIAAQKLVYESNKKIFDDIEMWDIEEKRSIPTSKVTLSLDKYNKLKKKHLYEV